ncbi:MAG: hypothetical protein ACM3JB_11060 [Acidobacteriaceae bacterium]
MRGVFRPGTFDAGITRYGTSIKEELESVRFAIVHRYVPPEVPDARSSSETTVRNVMACLRLIRPMRSRALMMRGEVRDDGTFDVRSYDIPPLYTFEVPTFQKLFKLRNCDCEELTRLAPDFLRVLSTDEVWKFRMSVQFHELGHFQSLDWKARYLLWCSAIESIYTTNNPEHKGTRVAVERIKCLLGENTSIYPVVEINEFEKDPNIRLGTVVEELYAVRNYLAHGDRIPDRYFSEQWRESLSGPVALVEVLTEAASFIIRTTLTKILREGMLNHFRDEVTAEAYWDAKGLTNNKIRARLKAVSVGNP